MTSRFGISEAPVAGSETGITLADLRALLFERNPFQPLVPDSIFDLSAPLHEYLQEQASILREVYDREIQGVSYRSSADLNTLYETEIFPLGTQGSFFDATYGQILCIFCRFMEMTSTNPGAPVGTVVTDDSNKFVVTNDLGQSTATNILGLLPQTQTPSNGMYGWVIIEGPNLQPVEVMTPNTSASGVELGWGETGRLSTDVIGSVIAVQITNETRDMNNPYIPGDLDILKSSSIGTVPIGQVNTRVDTLESELGDATASITQLESVFTAADEALAQQILNVSASLGDTNADVESERSARVAQGIALAEAVDSVSASLSADISASVLQITQAYTSADTAIAQRVTELDSRFIASTESQDEAIAGFEEDIRVLTSQAEATADKVTQVDASLVALNGAQSGTATALQQLTARVTINEGDITSNAQSITNLTATVSSNTSGISGNASAISSLDARVVSTESGVASNASAVTSLTARVTSAEGLISGNISAINDINVRVNQNDDDITVQAAQIFGLNADITTAEGNISANTSDISSIQGNINSIEARRTISVNANNVITGIELISGSGGISQVTIQADRFIVTNSAGTGQSPFRIVGNTTFIQNAVIENSSLVTDKLAANAVTQRWASASQADQTIPVNQAWHNVVGATTTAATTAGAELVIQAGVNIELSVRDGDRFEIDLQVVRAGVSVGVEDSFLGKGNIDIQAQPQPWYGRGTGTFRLASNGRTQAYGIQIRLANPRTGAYVAPDNWRVKSSSMVITEYKR